MNCKKNLPKKLCAIILTPLLLSACAKNFQSSKATYNIYQTDCLRLSAGEIVHTKDGTYIPQCDEIWYAPKFVERLAK